MKGIVLVFLSFLAVGFTAGFVANKERSGDLEEPDFVINLMETGAIPSEITASPGNIVQFNARDNRIHSLIQAEGPVEEKTHGHENGGIVSGVFALDEAWRLKLAGRETLYFHDHLHPEISVTIHMLDNK